MPSAVVSQGEGKRSCLVQLYQPRAFSAEESATRSRSPAFLALGTGELRLRTRVWSREFRCNEIIVAVHMHTMMKKQISC